MVKVLSSTDFDENVTLSEIPVLVDMYADWCGPCKMMAPVVEEIAEETEGQVLVCKLNVDQAMDIAQKYKVVSIPTFLIFKGGQLTDRVIGATDKEDLLEKQRPVRKGNFLTGISFLCLTSESPLLLKRESIIISVEADLT